MSDKRKKSKLPWGIEHDKVQSASTVNPNKLKAFSQGQMNTSIKKTPHQLKKEAEERKRKEDEKEAARAYEEFLADFAGDPTAKTFVKGNVINDATGQPSGDKGKLWRPPGMIQAQAPSTTVAVPKKGKGKEKKKSNLELFKERIKKEQAERDARHALKKAAAKAKGGDFMEPVPLPASLFEPFKGSFDNGDPTTTNLYCGNLSPLMTEDVISETFGRFGPLASVKVMWPRTTEERGRGRLCGFVAFMRRADGEKALEALQGKDLLGSEIKLGWGKAVPLPPRPFYVFHGDTGFKLQTGLPFNAQPKRKDAPMYSAVAPPTGLAEETFEAKIADATVVVVIPPNREIRQLIHRTIEFVIRHGPPFEALLMTRTSNDPKFKFLSNNMSMEHVYYRWKLFSVLQGDRVKRWNLDTFKMFKGGSTWQPPPEDQLEQLEEVEKGHLSNSDRDRLEDLLRSLTPERRDIAKGMVFAISHADASQEVVEWIADSLGVLETPLPTKIARLFLVSDILHNCGTAPIRNAASFRTSFEAKLPEIFKHLNTAYRAITGRLRADNFRKNVMGCFKAWKDWNIFTPAFFADLESLFYNGTKASEQAQQSQPAPTQVTQRSAVGNQDEDEDLDGVPLEAEPDEDLDGEPLDLDGEPLEAEPTPSTTPSSNKRKTGSKWDRDSDDEEDEDNIFKKAKS
eukprot:m.142018 g.142018  ORF g.142018 m.142018 type:complete len:684 (-) comp14870_c0_seq1:784-2835(-)